MSTGNTGIKINWRRLTGSGAFEAFYEQVALHAHVFVFAPQGWGFGWLTDTV